MTELQTSLKKCKVQGSTLFLPSENLANYADVRKALLNAGAKYKKNTFVFPSDAQPYIDRLMGGDKVNIKKEFQFFGTPAKLADYLVQLANIKGRMCILEPSAGEGAIIEAIYRAFPHYMKGPNDEPGVTVDYCELMDINRKILSDKISKSERWKSSTSCMGEDYLKFSPGKYPYDRIIANPPFNKNQDIDHIKKMYDDLKEGGRLVAVSSKSWTFGSQKKQVAFREWLDEVGATREEIQPGAFKESGTEVGGIIIIIDK